MNELNEPIFIGTASELNKENLPEIDLEVLLAEIEEEKKILEEENEKETKDENSKKEG